MPENSHEPENYSIDDMIDRLKRRPAEGSEAQGELVTRADGTQAIRVRKRKRRSQQPQKDEQARSRRMLMVQVSGAFLLIVLLGLAAGGAMIFGNSPAFRNRMLAGARTITGAEVQMRGFRVNPKTANATSLEFSWPEGHILRRLAFRSLTADIYPASFLGQSLTGEELSGGNAEMSLDFPVAGQPRSSTAPSSKSMDIRFQRYAARDLQVTLGPPASPVLRLRESEFTLQNQGGDSRLLLLINNGTLTIPGAPVWRVDRGHVEFRDDDIDVIGLRLQHATDNRGHMKFTGTLHPFDAKQESTLAVQLDDFPFDALVGESLGKVLIGRVATVEVARSNFFSFHPAEETHGVLDVTFESTSDTPFEIKGLPACTQLARLLDDKWLETPVFDSDVKGTIRRAEGEVVLSNLECENRSRISLKANLRITADNQLTGTLRLGIADGMLKAAQNSRLERVFSGERQGFRWVDLTISGRPDAPLDNFSALYDAAPASADAALPGSTGTPSFQELTAPE